MGRVMPGLLTKEGLNFLYRSEHGNVSRKTWWLGVILLDAILIVLLTIWFAVSPWVGRGLDERAMIDGKTMVAYVYAIILAFALLLIAVCYVNLTSKRFQTRGFNHLPAGLAGIPLVLLLLAGGLFWIHLRVPDIISIWIVYAAIASSALALFWHVVELGLRPDPE